MKAHLLRRDEASADRIAGMVVCGEVRDAQGATVFAKGAVLGASELAALMALPWNELHLIEPEPHELREADAAHRLAAAVAGDGVDAGTFSAGRSPLTATCRGVLDVQVDRLRRMNSLDGICVYTLYTGQLVEPAEVVAQAKITPFVLDAERVDAAERIAREDGGVVRVRPFIPMVVGAVVKETLGRAAMARFRDALETKISWFGSRLIEPSFVPAEDAVIAAELESLAARGAQLLLIAGAKAMDPLDPAFLALQRLGVPLDRYGVPAHPGSLFWTAHMGTVPIVGMPTCGLFSRATVFDLVLPRVLVGEPFTSDHLAGLGHGGLITRDMSYRFPEYDPTKRRGAVE